MTDPTSDLVERLKVLATPNSSGKLDGPAAVVATRAECAESAAEIERLRAENAKLLRAVQLWANADAEEH